MKYVPGAIWSIPGGVPFDGAFQHAKHSGCFLRSYFSLHRFHNGGWLVRDETGRPGNGCGDGPASHFHPTGIRWFRKQQRALRELKCPRLRIERKNGVRTHPSEREISEFQFGA